MQPYLPPEIVLNILHFSASYCERRWITLLQDDPLLPDLDFAREPDAGELEANFDTQLTAPRESFAPYAWILLTHVCRSWRDLALSTSSLWTHIAIVKDMDAVEEMLKRAGEQHIMVTLGHHTERTFAALDYILKYYAESITALVIPALPDLITASHAARASRLKSLVFIGPGRFLQIGNGATYPQVPFEFPALEHLRTIPPLCSSFAHLIARTLTSLVLRHPRASLEDSYVHPPHVLAQALVHTPLLEVLSLDVGSYIEHITIAPRLPRLRRLAIRGRIDACMPLYLALHVPRNTQLDLECMISYHATGEQLASGTQDLALMLACPAQVIDKGFDPVVSFALLSDADGSQLGGWRSEQPLHGLANDPVPDVVLKIPHNVSFHHLSEVLSALPLARPRVARLRYLPGTADPAVRKMACTAATLPTLAAVVLDGAAPHVVCDVAARTPARRLVVRGTRFLAPRGGLCRCTWPAQPVPRDGLTARAAFESCGAPADFVAACSACESPFDELVLEDTTGLDDGDVEQLRAVVGHLIIF